MAEAVMTEQSAYGSAGVGFIDGDYAPMAELRLPVTDMGFQLSDMCYDAVHVRNGAFFRLEDHLDRWEHSLAARRYDTLGHSRDAVTQVLHACVAPPDAHRDASGFPCRSTQGGTGSNTRG